MVIEPAAVGGGLSPAVGQRHRHPGNTFAVRIQHEPGDGGSVHQRACEIHSPLVAAGDFTDVVANTGVVCSRYGRARGGLLGGESGIVFVADRHGVGGGAQDPHEGVDTPAVSCGLVTPSAGGGDRGLGHGVAVGVGDPAADDLPRIGWEDIVLNHVDGVVVVPRRHGGQVVPHVVGAGPAEVEVVVDGVVLVPVPVAHDGVGGVVTRLVGDLDSKKHRHTGVQVGVDHVGQIVPDIAGERAVGDTVGVLEEVDDGAGLGKGPGYGRDGVVHLHRHPGIVAQGPDGLALLVGHHVIRIFGHQHHVVPVVGSTAVLLPTAAQPPVLGVGIRAVFYRDPVPRVGRVVPVSVDVGLRSLGILVIPKNLDHGGSDAAAHGVVRIVFRP